MAEKSPAFQFYPREYLGSEKVALMDLEHEGPYLRALCYCWLNGSIPSDPKQLAKLIGKGCTEDAARVVQVCFDLVQSDPSRMTQKTLDRERNKQRLWAEKSASGGKKSGQIRKEKAKSKGGSRVVEPKANIAFASSSAFASSNKERTQPNGDWFSKPLFSDSWIAWEKARKKKAGDRQYEKLVKLSDGNIDTAIAILCQSADNQWMGIFELKGGNNGIGGRHTSQFESKSERNLRNLRANLGITGEEKNNPQPTGVFLPVLSPGNPNA